MEVRERPTWLAVTKKARKIDGERVTKVSRIAFGEVTGGEMDTWEQSFAVRDDVERVELGRDFFTQWDRKMQSWKTSREGTPTRE